MTRPPGKKVIGSKWVLRIKTDAEGKVDKFKARVVAKGFRQIEGVCWIPVNLRVYGIFVI